MVRTEHRNLLTLCVHLWLKEVSHGPENTAASAAVLSEDRDGGQVTIEGTWKFAGGTGKLEGLTGGGSYKGQMTSPVEVENTWEGKYQIAAKTQAA